MTTHKTREVTALLSTALKGSTAESILLAADAGVGFAGAIIVLVSHKGNLCMYSTEGLDGVAKRAGEDMRALLHEARSSDG